jgi:hypothetical protein
MAAGDLEKAGCAKCILIVRGQESPLRYDKDAEAEFAKPQAEQSPYARNLATLKREIAAGADVLEAKPTVLSVTPSYACNIRCVHCFQEPLRTKDMDSPPLFKEMLELSDSMSFIQCGGGEPLLLPLWKEFLSHVDLEKNPYLTLEDPTLGMGTCRLCAVRFKPTVEASFDGIAPAPPPLSKAALRHPPGGHSRQ